MKLLSQLSAVALLCFSTSSALANDTFGESQPNVHTFGAQLGVAGLDYKGDDTDGADVVQNYLYYNYHFMPNFALEVGLIAGQEIEDWDCFRDSNDEWECFNEDDDRLGILADEFDFSALVFAIKADLPISQRNSLYAKLGAQYYDYELSFNRTKVADETGVGLILEAGWAYRWDFGLGMNAGVQFNHMDDAELHSFNVGVSYQF